MTASAVDITERAEATTSMQFEGIHHVTCITGDAPGNVDFYTRVLGLLRRRARKCRRRHHVLRVPGRPSRPRG
jgi:hypothetical protein